jgi:hypothetical protein
MGPSGASGCPSPSSVVSLKTLNDGAVPTIPVVRRKDRNPERMYGVFCVKHEWQTVRL